MSAKSRIRKPVFGFRGAGPKRKRVLLSYMAKPGSRVFPKHEVRFKKAKPEEISMFREKGWLKTIRHHLDALIRGIRLQENVSRGEAIRISREENFAAVMNFLIEGKRKNWVYELRLDLEHGLFYCKMSFPKDTLRGRRVGTPKRLSRLFKKLEEKE